MSTFAMHVAKTGLNSQQIKMGNCQQFGNVNTTGFKADRANFESLYQILRSAGDNTSENTSLTSGLCRYRYAPSKITNYIAKAA